MDRHTSNNWKFFQDNLAASRLNTSDEQVTGYPMVNSVGRSLLEENRRWSGFQMLTSWTSPFNDDQVKKTAFTTPIEAMKWAFTTYGSTYFEVYAKDLDRSDWQSQFSDMAEIIELQKAAKSN